MRATTGGIHTPLLKTTLTSGVADALIAFILEEGLQDGDLLPATADLAERYGVSRTVVREAIADLAGRGIVERSQGRETIVVTPGTEKLHGLLQFRVLREGVSPEEVMETRRSIETITAGLAAARRKPEHVVALETALAEIARAENDSAFHDADVRFHHVLAEASANRLILLLFEGLESLVRELRIRATQGRRKSGQPMAPVVDAHRAIFEAVRDSNPARAERAMDAHLRQTEAGLLAMRQAEIEAPTAKTGGA
jgi:GntR family transcriptional repressor for pyruvate dehydrogenase complex